MLNTPYVPTMRLGQGFNSFTQELCGYDAVSTSRLQAAAEGHTGCSTDVMLTEDKHDNTQETVSYCSTSVNQIREIIDLLNNSGPKCIRDDDAGGGCSLRIDFSKFHESDVNYFIHVKVVNRHLVASDLTSFNPIDGVPPSDFTRVYGDSFISGFTEGGEFCALISIKLRDRSTEEGVRERLKAHFNLKGESVSNLAQADPQEDGGIEGETMVSVSWTGGGKVNGGNANEWTLKSLRAFALEFPQHAIAHPKCSSAILTKYANLRSFQGLRNKLGSPLNYERVQFYSSSLLDAYLDYKLILHNITQVTRKVAGCECTLERGTDISHFTGLALQATSHYEKEMDEYNEQAKLHFANEDEDDTPTSSIFLTTTHAPDPPTRPNELVPYSADIFGLDRARRDCLSEMLKIVREVEIVATNPNIASNASADRVWQYLSPTIFRMLLPIVKPLNSLKATDNAAQVAATQINAIEDLNKHLTETKTRLDLAQSALQELKPYNFLPTVGLDIPIRLKSANTKRVFDFHIPSGDSLRQWDCQPNNGNQKFKLVKANSLGYYIIHCDSARYVAADSTNTSSDHATRMVLREHFASLFGFEDFGDGSVLLADQPQYTVSVDPGNLGNGSQLQLWPKSKSTNDRWYLEVFQ